MKILISIISIFLFLPAMKAQELTREVTKDSFSLVSKTDPRSNQTVWFENRIIQYNTGEIEQKSVLVGNNPAAPIPVTDTAQVMAIYASIQEGIAGSLVSAARTIILQDQAIKRMLENNRAITSAQLPNVFTYIQNQRKFEFVDSSGVTAYKFKVGQGAWQDATIELNANGVPFLKWGGTNSKRITIVAGGFIVVNDYPSAGQELYLYQVEPRWYESLNRSVKLVRFD